LIAVSISLISGPACKEQQRRERPARSGPLEDTPTVGKEVLQKYARYHQKHLVELGRSTGKLFAGKPNPKELRQAATYFERAAKALSRFEPKKGPLGELIQRRAGIFKKMTAIWRDMAQSLEAGDRATYSKHVKRIVEQRALDLLLRKKLRRLYEKQGLEPPL
jgi:hypothetical protein